MQVHIRPVCIQSVVWDVPLLFFMLKIEMLTLLLVIVQIRLHQRSTQVIVYLTYKLLYSDYLCKGSSYIDSDISSRKSRISIPLHIAIAII
jgi:hypothetical protein